MRSDAPVPTPTRRTVLAGLLGIGAAAVLGGCNAGAGPAGVVGSSAVAAAEAARVKSGRSRRFALNAAPAQVDLGGTVVSTWAYGGRIPGAVFRAAPGDRIQVAFSNALPDKTSVHWHGVAIRNDMDGVPDLTTPSVPAGGRFDYDFTAPGPGTHWFHPHTGLQTDHGLYAAFIIDDPQDAGRYDQEWIVILDDWTDGLGPTPEQIYANLKNTSAGGGMGQMAGRGMGAAGMVGDSGDVVYPLYLINGRGPTDPDVLTAAPGQRIRLPIINAGADTIFDVALADHTLRVTHTDGFPVRPVGAAAIRLGMGERYDAVITARDGVYPLVARPVGRAGLARALLRAGAGTAPAPGHQPAELDDRPLTVDRLTAAAGSALPAHTPDSVQQLLLGGSMSGYAWTINGRTYDNTRPLTIRQGQTTRLRIRNASMMSHPIHVHGHSFQLGAAGGAGPRKDTVLVPAMGAIDADLLADNPGRWMVHCHNSYHAEAGMMTRLDYLA
jgi:FtsP/CotA-like multicopper oxidase with cupredoxin domain